MTADTQDAERLAEIRERYANLDGARTVSQHPIDAVFLLRLLDARDARITALECEGDMLKQNVLARADAHAIKMRECNNLTAALAQAEAKLTLIAGHRGMSLMGDGTYADGAAAAFENMAGIATPAAETERTQTGGQDA